MRSPVTRSWESPSQPACRPSWLLAIALFLLTPGHSGLVVFQQPCCSAVGHCLVPLAPCRRRLSHLVRGVFQLPCSLKPYFSVVLAAGCTLNPGCQDLGLFCRSFLCGTLSSSDQASVASDALVKPRLDFVLMSRRRSLVSGLFGCSVLRFRCESNSKFGTNPRNERRSRQWPCWLGLAAA